MISDCTIIQRYERWQLYSLFAREEIKGAFTSGKIGLFVYQVFANIGMCFANLFIGLGNVVYRRLYPEQGLQGQLVKELTQQKEVLQKTLARLSQFETIEISDIGLIDFFCAELSKGVNQKVQDDSREYLENTFHKVLYDLDTRITTAMKSSVSVVQSPPLPTRECLLGRLQEQERRLEAASTTADDDTMIVIGLTAIRNHIQLLEQRGEMNAWLMAAIDESSQAREPYIRGLERRDRIAKVRDALAQRKAELKGISLKNPQLQERQKREIEEITAFLRSVGGFVTTMSDDVLEAAENAAMESIDCVQRLLREQRKIVKESQKDRFSEEELGWFLTLQRQKIYWEKQGEKEIVKKLQRLELQIETIDSEDMKKQIVYFQGLKSSRMCPEKCTKPRL